MYLTKEVLSCMQSDHSIKSDDYNICCEFMVNLGKHFGLQPLNFELFMTVSSFPSCHMGTQKLLTLEVKAQ